MKIHEYQARELFKEFDIPVSDAHVASNPEEVKQAAEKIGLPVVVKAQVLVGGRGKAGGVKIAKTLAEAETVGREIFGLTIKGLPVKKVLVAKAEEIKQEYYLGLTVDRSARKITLMISAEGGVEIEDLAVNSPEKILRAWAKPGEGFDRKEIEQLVNGIFPSEKHASSAAAVIEKLYRLFIKKGCSVVEINPFAVTGADELIALDSKINFDDNAVPLHPEIEKLKNLDEYDENELQALKGGLHFIPMDGEIGCLVNGAGLAMATMDLIKHYGSEPANFLDVGGSSNPEKVLTALSVVMRIPSVKGILFNIFGGITRCDDIAEGILMAKEKLDIPVPLVIRLIGTNDNEGRKILQEAGISAMQDLDEAVKKIVALTGGS
jgi:succinyl-CoA synthetase beta subunit